MLRSLVGSEMCIRDSNQCVLSCPDNSQKINDYCLCNDGYFNKGLTSTVSCEACSTTCKRCPILEKDCTVCVEEKTSHSESGDCKCPEYYEYVNNQCQCIEGFYEECNETCQCKPCQNGCSMCEDETACSNCGPNFEIVGSQCVACASTQYYSDDLKCVNCPTNCLRCDKSICSECKQYSKLVFGVCECCLLYTSPSPRDS